MRSIPVAMTWELFRRGRWRLVGGALAANALPAIVLAALRFQGGLSPREPSTVEIHYMMMQLNMFMFGAAVFAVQGSPSRLYALPVTTATIVAWHLLPAMVVMVAESVLSTLALNALFDLGWPVWGPALFLAVMLAGIDAAIWLTEKSAWTVLAIALVAAAFGFWFKSRFGPLFSPPQRLWTELTAARSIHDGRGGAVGLCRRRDRRRAESPRRSLARNRDRRLDQSGARPAPALGAPFPSPHAAQFWFEWRRKGWPMPMMVALLMVFGLAIWLIFSRDPLVLIGGVVAGGGMLSLSGFIGALLIGNCGPNDANYEIGQFLATRPMTSSEMARTLLKTAGLSTLIAWTVWAVAGLVVYGILLAMQLGPKMAVDRNLILPWWYFPATLFGPWTVATFGASILLTGRTRPFVIMGSVLFVLWLALLILAKYYLSQMGREAMYQGLAAACGVAAIGLTVWLFVVARRRALIGPSVAIAALAGWLVLCILAAMLGPRDSVGLYSILTQFPWQGWLVVAGLLALVVFPFAAMPLAIAWNRNR